MKIDRSRLKKCTSEVPTECQALISKLRSCSHAELLEELKQIDAWTFGKCELFHWIDVLDLSDSILEEAAARSLDNPWELACDLPQNREAKELLLWVLHFTTLLIEHSFSRHLYNSMEHLVTLLSSCDMHVVLGVLNLLYMFSKRSNFITRLNNDKRQALLSRLNHLAESWGGKENGFGLADCCKEFPEKAFPASATTLHFEFYAENPIILEPSTTGTSLPSTKKVGQTNLVTYIHIENVDKLGKTPAQIMNDLLKVYNVPQERQMALLTHIRLAHSFSDYRRRLQCVQARLQALSVLVYSNALQENAHSLLHAGLLEELVELLEIPHTHLVEIRAAALRTLTSIIHLDRNPHFPKKPGSRLNMIIDVTGASSYHGFLPVLVRTCITTLTSPQPDGQPFPLPLATALFSFLYHLASYEAGGEALVSCGMMESLLKVINWPGSELEHITFVTRAVRVIDLITNIDMQGFQTHSGLASFINRLDMEVNVCRKEQPFEIEPLLYQDTPQTSRERSVDREEGSSTSRREHETFDEREESSNSMEITEDENMSSKTDEKIEQPPDYSAAKTGKTCLPQRAALLKSMLNFLKKAIQDPAFSDSIRHVMEGTLPSSLKHIISNSEYYGPSLFLLATDVVTVYVFQEPSLLSSLQDNGLTDVVLHALLIKEVPATREVLGSLPNVFSALCLNQRGLESFVKRRPFERLFKVLLSPVYLSAMRRRRSADPLGDTASNLGNAMDELMRHQPSLKVDAIAAIIKLLEELCVLGCDPRYICWRAASKSENSPSNTASGNRQSSGQSVGVGVGDSSGGGGGGGGSSSDEEEEDEEEASTSSHPQREEQPTLSPAQPGPPPQPREKTPIALVEYIHNVMKFVDAILSNNSTDDHCREFVAQKGLVPLLSILGLPNLPVDYPVAQAAQSVASVCKSILNLAHEPLVLKTGLSQLNEVLNLLKPLHSHMESPGGSVLLHELASAPNLETAFTSDTATPLLHAMNAAHGYVVMFVHVCRTSQSDIRNLSMNHWGSELGLTVLKGLSELYMSLVWESTLLLALCSEDIIPAGCEFGKEDMDKLMPPELKNEGESSSSWSATVSADMGSNGMTTAMEALSTDPPPVPMEVDDKPSVVSTESRPNNYQLKYIKPLLGASSRLGRALSELFGLLVKLCMGSPVRQRRGQQMPLTPTLPSQAARSVATALNCLLTRGLSWDKLPPSPIPKFKLTFLICSVGFTSPMLFDEKRHPYHLMLQKFVKLNGQNAFFSTFHWALSGGGQFPLSDGLEHPNLPDGTGEFLDAWLMLLEKMVNPKAILDSPHVVSSKCTGIYKVCETFDPIKYLTDIHKKAFEAVMLMWGKKPLKNYGARMTESILSILRHILRGEKIIKERTEKEESGDGATASGSGASGVGSRSGGGSDRRDEPEADVNPEYLRQLMDMGFSRAHCIEALLHTLTVEQATDYLLTNPATLVVRRPDVPVTDVSGQGLIMDLELADDDQIMHAIAMSLGDTETRKITGTEDITICRETTITENIDEFTQNALGQCLNLLDLMPDTVYRICDLLVTITKRNGDEWRDDTLRQLMREVGRLVDHLIDIAESQDENAGSRLVECEEANKLSGRLYLYTLFFEGSFQEMRVPCAQIVEECAILDKLVRLLVVSEAPLTAHKNKIVKDNKDSGVLSMKTPKWLAPLLLLIDRLEKVATLTKRKQLMHKVTTRAWKWFDLSTGKWTLYSPMNNRIINDAYWAGESSVRISCSRRRYLITFSCMTQVNEDSDNRRPITMGFKLNTDKEDGGSSGSDSNMDTDESPVEEKRNTVIQGLDPSIAPSIVRACVKLLAIPVDRDALHAVLKVCLRLTRDYKNAEVFAREGGVKLLLEMTQMCSFTGCVNLCTLLIRHTLEEPRTLRLAMEKVIRARTQSNIPPAYKEILFMTRQISSAVCRNPEVYREVCENILRVDISCLKKDDIDNRLVVKALPPSHSPALPMVEEISVGVIRDMLNALIKPMPVSSDDGSTTPTSPEKKTSHAATTSAIGNASLSTTSSRRDVLRNNATTTNDPLDDDDQVSQIIPLKIYTDIGNNSKVEPEEAKKPILTKSAILKILAEAVRSYGAVASLITEHTYRGGQSEMVSEDTTALAFLLDKLLPMSPENSGDRTCSSMARMLIAAIASCNHSPDVQTTLVTEVKAALTRTLALPESSEKHAQLQLLIGLISTMIDSCPPNMSHTQLRASLRAHQYNNVNYIVRIMLRKGIITDLAKIPHSLDLSSPNMAGTINAALKPLETLSRIINQPMPGAVNNKFTKPKNRTVQEEPIGEQTGTTTSEATHAVGEEANEDAENTEHDISVTAESLEPTSESQVHEEGDEAALEDIMDQLLESVLFSRDGSAVAEEPSSRPHRPMDIDDESLAMRDAEGDFDPTRDTTEDLMSSDSDSDSNPSDDNEDEVQDDEDEEEEEEDDGEENEEEEEEEEEGSSNYEEDGIEFYEDAGEGGVFRMFPTSERDNGGNVVMIQHNIENQDIASTSTPVNTRPSLPWNTTFPLPLGLFEEPPAGSENNGISTHPLLISQGSLDTASTRTQRALRQRRYQYLQLSNPRSSNPPVILQRLLGPAAQTLPLSASQVLASSFRDTRVVVMDNGLGIFTNQEEEQIDYVDQSGYLFGPSLAATLNNIPTALHWWIEESKQLDGDSQPDCCVGVVHKLIPGLEKYRNAELAERKEKRKKQHGSEKENDKDNKEEKERLNNAESGSSSLTHIDEQRSSASTSQRTDATPLVAGEETAVETTRQERTPEEDIIDVTGEMEITVQEDDERPPPPPPEEQSTSDSRDPRTANRNPTLELAESIVDSVLGPCTSEATIRLNLHVSNDASTHLASTGQPGRSGTETVNVTESASNRISAAPIVVDFGQEVSEDLSRESSDSADWIRRLLTDDGQCRTSDIDLRRVERNANVVNQDPTSSTTSSETTTVAGTSEQSSQQSSQQQSQQQQQQQQQQSNNQEQQLPDGVDPSFLAALPEDMRDEVIAEQLRLQRMRQRAQASVVEELSGPVEVNPEFLAALPPAIQEEVLAQQRMEQQRHAAASANPEDPVDAAAFFQNLQPSLRQAILTDMEESQISVLPPDLAQEAQNLRREWEARNRHMMQERFLNHVSQSNTALSSILRNSGRARGGGTRYAIQAVPQRTQWNTWNPRGDTNLAHQGAGLRLRGRQLLDHESMACLLVLLFVDEPKINTLRLHRVIRNLCYHGSTREWIVKALLSIMERSNDENKDIMADFGLKFKRKGLLNSPMDLCSPKMFDQRNNTQSWLNISIDAALGCRANVFHIVRHAGKKSERQGNIIAIHPQAAPTVCRHTLELLISLAKSFPGYFVPIKSKELDDKDSNKEKDISGSKEEGGAKNKSASKVGRSDLPDFWDLLLKLDSCASKKGKSVARTHSNTNLGSEPEHGTTTFEASAFGQLISMLNWSVIKRSSQLTDKLLRLLSLISIGLTEVNSYRRQDASAKNKKTELGKDQSVAAPEGHLKLAVQVLTSKSCSEDGLEDATALLLNLSHCPDPTRQLILKLLLEGAMELANMVCEHINDLMMELKVLNCELSRRNSLEDQPSTSGGNGRGILLDRFTNENVVVTAPSKVKAGSDLQLPSMAALVSKTSSQAFFLRILKVIVQIREAVRLANTKKTGNQTSDTVLNTGTSNVLETAADNADTDVPMDTTQANTSNLDNLKTSSSRNDEEKTTLPLLSESLVLDNLWETLSACLLELEYTPDHHAVLVLQPAVEAFFLVHSSSSTSRDRDSRLNTTSENREVVPDLAPVSPIYSDNEGTSQSEAPTNASWDITPTPTQKTLPPDQLKFLKFAETHRTVLNQILRQTTTHLADGPFSVLVDHTRVLDFDVKRRYFRTELERMDEGIRREELAVHVRRSHVFEDSFRELHRRNADEWKNRFYIVFEGEEGQDAGGLLREWYVIISREIFNPMYALFTVSPGDRVTYMINSSSHCNPNHLCYYKFVGRVIAKAIYDNKLLECYFTRSFYKHILGILVKHTDMESEDYSFYKGLVYLTEHNISDLGYELTFSTEVNEFGVNDVRDLIPNGRNIIVTEETKLEYIRLVCQMKMTGAIRKQLNAFLEGFYDIIPKRLISIFNEQELELLISGLPNVDIEDLKANTEYHKYTATSLQIQWFWRALRGFDQADRAKFLQFVTGTSKVPLQGFAALEGMNGVQKFQIHREDRSTDRLPSAHTCFNQLDLPVYETYDKLRTNLLKAIHECSEGFGFA